MLSCFALIYALYICMGSIVGIMLAHFCYNPKETSIISLFFVLMGVIGSAMNAILLDKFKAFKKQLLVIGSLVCLSIFALFFLLKTGDVYLGAIGLGLMGFNVISIIAHGYSCGCKLSYPAGEGTTLGVMLILSTFLGVGLAFLSTYIINLPQYEDKCLTEVPEHPPNPIFYICFAMAAAGTIIACLLKFPKD